MQTALTKGLSEEYKKYLHEDFLANEEHYWRVREKLLKEYKGWWVAIHKGQVVASTKDVWEITEAVGKLGCHAYIAKVGEEDIVFKVRRLEFAYDQSYRPFALPQAEVTFANYAYTSARLYSDVIPDTGADLSILPERDCLDIDLFSSPYLPTLTRGVVGASVPVIVYRGNVEVNGHRFPSLIQFVPEGHERMLGRDVLNQMRVIFDAPANKVTFEP